MERAVYFALQNSCISCALAVGGGIFALLFTWFGKTATFCHWDNDQEWMIVVLQCIILNGERVVHVIASGNRDNKLSSTDSWSNLVACFA